MNSYVTGKTIKDLREKKELTQKQLADMISVSDRAVSKWETQKGLPDITLLEPLSQALGVTVSELLSGECIENRNRSANMLRSRFYVCPVCGNVIHAMGEGSFSCCGITLPPVQEEEPDPEHKIEIETVDEEFYVRIDHPMTKEHSISFLAYLTSSSLQMIKLYPEQTAEGRFRKNGHGKIFAYCNRHGLFADKI
ncbi:MAG: helix-turn-helix domain-containing protein [Lachnospiraceae bacterium]|jgi:transcriptional regulator with XRE-family HTH domain/desulfoferrodoxin (superoxide reductase-like protein)|nr:helix-turn-helix domain-containing protein [Lachnospiraceae bacterium]MCI1726960.1 helix-turn-helix domain-containing protein [Lachnospiraceae bacterium]